MSEELRDERHYDFGMRFFYHPPLPFLHFSDRRCTCTAHGKIKFQDLFITFENQDASISQREHVYKLKLLLISIDGRLFLQLHRFCVSASGNSQEYYGNLLATLPEIKLEPNKL